MRADGLWLLSERAADSGILEMDWSRSTIEARAFFDDREAASYSLVDGVATIPIFGVLTKQADFFFSMMGGSAVYPELIQAILAAEGDDDADEIVLHVSSPGGEVAGLFELVQTIFDTAKPIRSFVEDMAASAAYAVVAATDRIELNNRLAMVGSIGVMTSQRVGEDIVRLRSTDAPDKNPDAATEAGREAITRELDAIHAEFAGLIARGRGVSVDAVNTEYGRGGLVIAAAAVDSGMADGISATSGEAGSGVATAIDANRTEGDPVADVITSIEALVAAYPVACALLRTEAQVAGVTLERDRVGAHAAMGEATGPEGVKLAFASIGDGSEYNATAQAKYGALGLAMARSDGRDADDAEGNDSATPAGGADGRASASASPAGDAGAVEKAKKVIAFEDELFAAVKGGSASLAAPETSAAVVGDL